MSSSDPFSRFRFTNEPPDGADVLGDVDSLARGLRAFIGPLVVAGDHGALDAIEALLARAKAAPDAPGPLGRKPQRDLVYHALRAAIAHEPERPFAQACRRVFSTYFRWSEPE